jgi:hypothetical protein
LPDVSIHVRPLQDYMRDFGVRKCEANALGTSTTVSAKSHQRRGIKLFLEAGRGMIAFGPSAWPRRAPESRFDKVSSATKSKNPFPTWWEPAAFVV